LSALAGVVSVGVVSVGVVPPDVSSLPPQPAASAAARATSASAAARVARLVIERSLLLLVFDYES
jgi:hypothetical protein